MKDLIKKILDELAEIKEWFRHEVSSLRTGRATPALIEDLNVEYYGAKIPLKQVASISAPDARSLVIQPWDINALEAINKAIENSSLHVSPIADGDHIRLSLPQLTEERRKEICKVLNTKTEEARVRARRARDDVWKEIQQQEKDKAVSEDDTYRAKDDLQKQIDAFHIELETLRKKKEKEIIEI